MIDLEFSILNYFLFSGLKWGDDGCFVWVVKHYSVLNGPFIINLFTAIYCCRLGGSGF